MVKDSWEYEERSEKGLLLKEATEAGVKMWCNTITTKPYTLVARCTMPLTMCARDKVRPLTRICYDEKHVPGPSRA